jgi:hypothetical protein
MKLEDLETKLGIADMGEEDKLALVKEIQANIPALKAEQRVLEAKTQANLVVEAIKKIKESLEARFDELNGIVDVKVRDITSGKDGIDGKDGRDGVDGRNGKDGISITGPKGADGGAGEDGVGVQDAHIDFDGSLIITLTDGKELNVGEVVPMDVAEKIKIIGNGGGTSQSVLDAIAALTTATTTNAAITGGTIDNTVIGGTTPAAGTFTTLTATGQTSLGGAAGAEGLRVTTTASGVNWMQISGSNNTGFSNLIGAEGASSNIQMLYYTKGTNNHVFRTNGNGGPTQAVIAHTASAVNYVQVTGAATTVAPNISAQGSDTNIPLRLSSKGDATIYGVGNGNTIFDVYGPASSANYVRLRANTAGTSPALQSFGSDTDIDLTLTPKGAGNVRFGTYTAGILTPTGYITVKDSGGTTRRLLVG